MKIEPEIKILKEKKLIGKSRKMSLKHDKTGELWRSFMPFRYSVSNNLTTDLFSVQVYNPGYFDHFNPENEFEKWALLEVADFETIPEEMKAFTLPGGMYAMFLYKGPSTDNGIFNYIFSEWLPASVYTLDNRPHFQILGEKYKNSDPESEEEIWIPIRLK